jgi:hypothetical protein
VAVGRELAGEHAGMEERKGAEKVAAGTLASGGSVSVDRSSC